MIKYYHDAPQGVRPHASDTDWICIKDREGFTRYAYPIKEPEKIVNPMPEGSGLTPFNGIGWHEIARWMDEITAAVNALREAQK